MSVEDSVENNKEEDYVSTMVPVAAKVVGSNTVRNTVEGSVPVGFHYHKKNASLSKLTQKRFTEVATNNKQNQITNALQDFQETLSMKKLKEDNNNTDEEQSETVSIPIAKINNLRGTQKQ